MDHRVTPPGNHRIGISGSDQLGGFADRLTARCASGQAIRIWALCVEEGREVCGRHVRFLFHLFAWVHQLEPAA